MSAPFTFGYGGPTVFIEVVRETYALSEARLGFSVAGDRAVLPVDIAARVVALGDARFLQTLQVNPS
jgi:hypothetical protein